MSTQSPQGGPATPQPLEIAAAALENGGRVVAYDQTGNKLYSKASPGNAADFDEALELLVDAYPYRDSILKGEIKTGGGAQAANGATGPKTIKRDAFFALAPAEQAARIKDGFTVAE